MVSVSPTAPLLLGTLAYNRPHTSTVHGPEFGGPYSKMRKPTISFRDRQGSKCPSPLPVLPYPGVLAVQSH